MDGTEWAWGNPATVVLDGQFGEMSLRRVENKWVLAWFNAGNYEISISVFDSPTSNLYDATTYNPIVGTDWCSENDTSVAQLYGGFIHPDLYAARPSPDRLPVEHEHRPVPHDPEFALPGDGVRDVGQLE